MIRRLLALRTSGPDDTRALAAATAGALRPGDVVTLTGELGAGKTCFVQGAARALGVEGPVTSPTFTLVRTYRGALEVVHVDVYRLDRLQEVVDLGDEKVMGEDQVTFVEWGDTITPLLPHDRLEVEIVLADRPEDRTLRLRGAGEWEERLVDLVPSLAPWFDVAAPMVTPPQPEGDEGQERLQGDEGAQGTRGAEGAEGAGGWPC